MITNDHSVPVPPTARIFRRTWLIPRVNKIETVEIWKRPDYYAFPGHVRRNLAICLRLNPTFLNPVETPQPELVLTPRQQRIDRAFVIAIKVGLIVATLLFIFRK